MFCISSSIADEVGFHVLLWYHPPRALRALAIVPSPWSRRGILRRNCDPALLLVLLWLLRRSFCTPYRGYCENWYNRGLRLAWLMSLLSPHRWVHPWRPVPKQARPVEAALTRSGKLIRLEVARHLPFQKAITDGTYVRKWCGDALVLWCLFIVMVRQLVPGTLG